MNIQELKIGTRLEIEQLDRDGKNRGPVYVSQLLHAPSERNVVIASPIFESVDVPIHTGSHLRVISLHERQGLLSFNAIVRASRKKGNISMLVLEMTSPIKKIQRRGYYRLPCTLAVTYRLLDDENYKPADSVQSTELKRAVTKNLSATGLSIVTDEKYPKDAIIQVFIPLGNNEIEAVCKVMRSECVKNPRGDKYELGMHIVSISKQHQEQLVKYIFDQQRELLKKDLLER
jgi:c-di-GMP-binding flagellar brake protein YcgR